MVDLYLYPENEFFEQDKLDKVAKYLKERFFILQKSAAFCETSQFFILKNTEKKENRFAYCSIELMKNTIQINFPTNQEDFNNFLKLQDIKYTQVFFIETMKFIIETLKPYTWDTGAKDYVVIALLYKQLFKIPKQKRVH